MKTTLEFIADLKAKTGLDSDYAIAKHLGVTKNALSLYRTGKSFLGDQTAMKVAELLDIDPAYVVACVHAERTKHEAEKKLWERIATLTAGVSAALVITAILPAALHLDALNQAQAGPLYIMSNCLSFLALAILILYRQGKFPPERSNYPPVRY